MEAQSNNTGSARISTRRFQASLLRFGIINAVLFFLIALLLRLIHLESSSALVAPLDCLVLCFVSFYQLKKLAHESPEAPLKFLRSFSLVFFTGNLAFVLWGGLMLVWSLFDPRMVGFLMVPGEKSKLTEVFVIVAQGGAGSIIVSLIGMVFADRYADKEANP